MVLVTTIYVLMNHFRQGGKHWKKVCTTLLLVSIPPTIVFFAVRAYFSDLPNTFYWWLSLQGFLANMTQPKIGWITFPLTLIPPLSLFVIGLRHSGWKFISSLDDRQARLILSITIVSILYIIYSNCIATAYMSGRFVWPFYTALIPIAVLSSNQTALLKRWIGPISNRILGVSENK